MDPYEERLLGVFESCLEDGVSGRGLGEGGLSKLCDLLHLSPTRRAPLLSSLPRPPVSFNDFRDALLTLLQSNRTPSPDREVSPKFVYGQKKYGRRSRPESLDIPDETCRDLTIEEVGNDTFVLTNPSAESGSSSPIFHHDKKSDEDDDLSDNIDNRMIPSFLEKPEDNSEGKVGAETELRAAWERLGLDQTLNREELTTLCSAVDVDGIADQVVAHVFNTLKLDSNGRILFEEFVELFRSLPLLPQLQQGPTTSDLWEGIEGRSLQTSTCRIFQELQQTRSLVEALTEEREKLKMDLADSRRRAETLALEVDDQNVKAEEVARKTVRHLEVKHAELVKQLKQEARAEREELKELNKRLEGEALAQSEQMSKLSNSCNILTKNFEALEKENRVLSEKLKTSEMLVQKLQKQVDCMEILHQRVTELEGYEELSEELKKKLASTQVECAQLRDRNDELTSRLEEALTSVRLPQLRREASWEGSGAPKRKGSPPCCFCGRDTISKAARTGKVRRCSTENDLFFDGDKSCLADFQANRSESGLESDFDTLTNSPTLSNSSVENVMAKKDELEGLKAHVSELKHLRLDHHQTKEWEYSKIKLSDEESLPDSSEERNLQMVHVKDEFLREPSSPDFAYISKREVEVQTEMHLLLSSLIPVNVQEIVEVPHSQSNVSQLENETRGTNMDIESREGESGTTMHFEELSKFAFEFSDPLLQCHKSTEVEEELRNAKERIQELEKSLELLKEEYERTEDYWAEKLDEERRLSELYQQQSDEKFAELEAKIQEYAELLCAEQKKPQLPPIEEKDLLEKQFTDLEEEYSNFRKLMEEKLAEKEAFINNLEGVLSKMKSISQKEVTFYSRGVQVETHWNSELNNYGISDNAQEVSSRCLCLCHLRKMEEMRKLREMREEVKAQCDLLETQKQFSFCRPFTAQMKSREALMIQSLSGKLRHVEGKCRSLQIALRNHQKQSERALNKAWERHKADMEHVQEILASTQDRLNKQIFITRRQVEQLASADVLVKKLFVENSKLMLAVAKMEENYSQPIKIFNSF